VIAAGLVAFIGIGLALALVRTIVRWALSLPLVLFENVHPRHALGESAKRVVGARFLILWILVAWIVVASVLFIVATSSVDLVGRVVAPQLASSLVLLLLFIAVLALVGVVLTLAVSVVNFSLFALLLTRLYLRLTGTQVSVSAIAHFASSGPRRFGPRTWRSWSALPLRRHRLLFS
jgi:glycerophosphoryl diester phosphodiesterase